MSIPKNVNKAILYIKSMGLLRGLFYSFKRMKDRKKNISAFSKELPSLDEMFGKDFDNQSFEIRDLQEDEKNIFVFWWNGFDDAPEIVKQCIKSIDDNYKNRFKIIKIDQNNFNSYAEIDESIMYLFEKGSISIQTFSDILRFNLISIHGGVWIDSTVFISNPFDIENELKEKNFVTLVDANTASFFTYKGENVSWSSFFIGGTKNNPLFKKIYKAYVDYFAEFNMTPYFFTDMLLMIYKVHGDDKCSLKICEKNADDLFYVADHALKKRDESFKTCPQKLNWRIDLTKLRNKKYLINRLVEANK